MCVCAFAGVQPANRPEALQRRAAPAAAARKAAERAAQAEEEEKEKLEAEAKETRCRFLVAPSHPVP